MQIKTYNNFSNAHQNIYDEVFRLTKSAEKMYPNYKEWFYDVFIAGLKKKERSIIVVYNKYNKIIGCALLKNTNEENKICTLIVDKNYREQGVGSKLMDIILKYTKEKPLITVSSKVIKELKPLLDKFGFQLSAIKKNVYVNGDSEFYYNDKRSDLIKNRLIPLLLQQKIMCK